LKWSIRAFQALDSDSRGFLYKDELLDHIKASGTITTHQLRDLVSILEEKTSKDKIYLEEFEELIKGRNFIKTVLENNLVIP
jgi:Ca2+-binding EF-hand superfamily protein